MLKHIPFYASLLGENGATQSHVLLYGAIEAHSMGERGCIASNKTIAAEIGLSEGRTANLISELNSLGWVRVSLNDANQRTLIEPLMTLHADVNPPSRRREPPLHADVNIEHSNKNTVINNIKQSNKALVVKDPNVVNVQKFWVQTFGRERVFKPAEDAAVKRMVKEHGLEKVMNYVVLAKAGRGVQYCPVITNFRELESKWERLEAWGMRTQSQRLNRSVTITE